MLKFIPLKIYWWGVVHNYGHGYIVFCSGIGYGWFTNTFPSETVLRVSISESLVLRSGVWSTNLQHSSTMVATAWRREGGRDHIK